jgi:hypothetical protein
VIREIRTSRGILPAIPGILPDLTLPDRPAVREIRITKAIQIIIQAITQDLDLLIRLAIKERQAVQERLLQTAALKPM